MFSSIKKVKKRAVASVVAAVTALGVLLGGSFDSPAQLLEDGSSLSVPVMSDTLISQNEDNGDYDDAAVPGEQKRRGLRARVRAVFLRLPVSLRACVGIPLWCLGWLIISAVGLIWEPVLSPVMAAVLKCVCVAGIIVAALLMTVKAAFPDMPLKKILTRRSLSTAFFGAVVFGATGALMQIFLPESDRMRELCEGVILLAALILATVPVLRREARRRREQREENPPSPVDERKLITELADSVS